MERRELQKTRYLAAFAITTLIFVIGILIGNYFGGEKLENINDLEEGLKLDTLGVEVQYLLLTDLLLGENLCENIEATPLTEELYKISGRLAFMENELGTENEDVLRLKEYYSLLEIRHWLYLKKANEECDLDKEFILYFYSNKGDCNSCEKQGAVLTYIHKKYPDVNIYSFDINIENVALETIKKIYGLKKETPILIMKNTPNYGFKDINGIEELLGLGQGE